MYWFVHLFNHLKLFSFFALATLVAQVFTFFFFKEEFIFFFCYPYFYTFSTVQVAIGSISKIFSVYLYLIPLSVFTFIPSVCVSTCYALLPTYRLNLFRKGLIVVLLVLIIFLPVLVYITTILLFYALYSFLPINHYLLLFVFDLGPNTFLSLLLGLYIFLIVFFTVVLISFFGRFGFNYVPYVRIFSFFSLLFLLVLFLPSDPFTHFICFFFFGLGLEISFFYRSLIVAYDVERVA